MYSDGSGEMRIDIFGSILNDNDIEIKRHLSGYLKEYLDTGDNYRLKNYLDSLDGFYRIICRCGKYTLIISDRIRSHNTLFHYENGWILDEISVISPAIPDDQRTIFEASGFSLGISTLVNGLQQSVAGTIIVLDDSNTEIEVVSYQNFLVSGTGCDESVIESSMRKSIEKMVKHFGDKNYLVPLSGGYDSRYILTLLIQAGVSSDKIQCFTYGVKSSYEAGISKKVANSLGVKWTFIEQSKEFWDEWVNSDDFNQYVRSSSQFSSCSVIQDWPVIGKLLRDGIIDKSYVVVPGHAGDFVAGSHFIAPFLDSEVSYATVNEYLKRKHFALSITSKRTNEMIEVELEKYLVAAKKLCPNLTPIAYFEWWDWRERQSKLIFNSVRAYEYWGLQWWCPFWSKDVFDSYQNIRFENRISTKSYLNVVNKIYSQQIGTTLQDIGSERVGFLNFIKAMVKEHFSFIYESKYVVTAARKKKYRDLKRTHPMAWNAIPGLTNTDDSKSLSFYNVFSKITIEAISNDS
ncbi:asparagine synthase-related protein [Vibrio diabolicus]